MPSLDSLNEQLMDAFRNRIHKLCAAEDYAQAERECQLFLNVSQGTAVAGGALLAGFAAHHIAANESNDWYSYFTNSIILSNTAIAAGLGAVASGAAFIAANNAAEVKKMLSIVRLFNNVLKDIEIPAEYADLPMAWKLAYAGKWRELYFVTDKIQAGITDGSPDFRKELLLYPSLTNAYPLTGEYRNKTILWLAAKADEWNVVDNLIGIHQWVDQHARDGKASYNLDKIPVELELNITPDGNDPDAGVSVIWLFAKDGDFSFRVSTALHLGADASLVPLNGPDRDMPVMWLAAHDRYWSLVEKNIRSVPYVGWAPQSGEFRDKTVLWLFLDTIKRMLLDEHYDDKFKQESLVHLLSIVTLFLERGAKISEITTMDLPKIVGPEQLDIFFKFAPLELLKLYVEKNKITIPQLIQYARSNANFSVVRILVDNEAIGIVKNALTNVLGPEDLDEIVAMIRKSSDRNIFILSYCDVDELKEIIKQNLDLEIQSLPILQELAKTQDAALLAGYLTGTPDDETLICQISHGMLLDPVSLPGLASNKFFERSSILQWINSKGDNAYNPLSPNLKITKASILEPSPEQLKDILIAVRSVFEAAREKSAITASAPTRLKPN
jgi:hypothetical protein